MSISTRARTATGLTSLVAIVGALLIPATGAAAETGAPPESAGKRVLSKIHTDAVSTYFDDGQLVLGTKADVPEGHGTRFDPADVMFNVESAAQFAGGVPDLPAFAFLGEPGSPLWMTPQTQDPEIIWPGFSTEDPKLQGKVDGNRIGVELTAVDGPGTVEIFQTDALGSAIRWFSSEDELPAKQLAVPQHAHANWAFSAAGRYVLTFTQTASIGGVVQTASNDYVFEVGDIAPAATTSVALDAGETSVVSGATVDLTATITPANAVGWVEFLEGESSIGWTELVDGKAVLASSALATGEHRFTARFIPAVSNDFTPSVSEAFLVTAGEPVGDPAIAVGALAGHYHSNETIALTSTPSFAPDGSSVQWKVLRTDQTTASVISTEANTSLVSEQALDGATVTAELLDAAGATLAVSDALTIHVDDHGSAPKQQVTVSGLAGHYHSGDAIELSATVAPASVLTSFQWFAQKQGATAPSKLNGETGTTLSLTASAEWNGAAVFAALQYDNGIVYVQSAPALIEVDDHNEVPATELSFTTSRDADDFWEGQTATLTAKQSVPTGLTSYQWLAKNPGSADFTPIAGANAEVYAFKPAVALSGIQVKVQLLHGTEVHAESAATTFTFQRHEPTTVISVTSDKAEYAIGDEAHFVSAQSPQTTDEHYHWYTQAPGSTAWVWVPESRDADLKLPITDTLNGSKLIIRLFDHDHAILAESAPVTITVAGAGEPEPQPEPEPGAKPTTTPAAQTGAALDGVEAGGISLSSDTVNAGSIITVDVGAKHAGSWNAAWLFSEPVLLNGDWTQANAAGRFAVTIPADAPAGAHRIAVFDADGSLVGWAAITVNAAGSPVTAAPAGGAGGLADTGVEAGLLVGLGLALALAGGGFLVIRKRREPAAE